MTRRPAAAIAAMVKGSRDGTGAPLTGFGVTRTQQCPTCEAPGSFATPEALRMTRAEAGLPLKVVAEILGLHITRVSEIERGRRRVTPKVQDVYDDIARAHELVSE